MNYTKLAREMKKNMVQQGLDPDILKSYLQQTVERERKQFEINSPKLSERDRNQAELPLLQGELLLAVIDRCCEVNG